MRPFILLMAGGVLAAGQSHPGWWTFVAPESKSLVGIQWSNLRDSPFGDAVREELSSGGRLAFPNLPCLMNAHDFLISSPPLLAAANGACAPPVLRTDAIANGMKAISYRGFELWIAASKPNVGSGASAMSVAQSGDRIVLIGRPKSLEAAIDRTLAETRTYSPLLMPGSRLARTRDLWVVASELPDPLASVFVPAEVSESAPDGGILRGFEGGISVREGLDLGATLDAGSDGAAAQVAANIRKSAARLPSVANGLQAAASGHSVALGLHVAKEDLEAGLRSPGPPSPIATPRDGSPGDAVSHDVALPTTPVNVGIPVVLPTPAVKVGIPAEPTKSEPQIIRIYGLDGGTREIVLPPVVH